MDHTVSVQERLCISAEPMQSLQGPSEMGTPVPGNTPLALALMRARHEAARQGLSAQVSTCPELAPCLHPTG